MDFVNELLTPIWEQIKKPQSPPPDETDEMDMAEDPENTDTTTDPTMDSTEGLGDDTMADGGDFGAMDATDSTGMGAMDATQDPTTIGRVYELKKIYNRLLSIESYLATSSDIILLKLRNYITQSIELFDTLISNVDAYKDKLDDIVVLYYEFIEYVYSIMKRYYEIQSEEENNKDKKSSNKDKK